MAPTGLSASGSPSPSGDTFSIPLTVGVKWKITVKRLHNGEPILAKTYEMPEAVSASTVLPSFYLMPLPSGSGTISLGWGDDDDDAEVFSSVSVASVKKNGSDALSAWNDAVNVSVSGIETQSPLASGVYEVTLHFKKGGRFVYATTQAINVFPNMVTNTWVSNGGTGPIRNGTFAVTEQLVQAYMLTNIYVGDNDYKKVNASDNNSGTPYAPLETLGAALSRLTDSTKDYTIHISGTQVGPFTLGASEAAPNFAARSVTLCGMTGNTTDILSVAGVATILTITTRAPVTIRKLKISSGYNTSENSAGINMEAGSKLILDDGALVTMNSGYMRGAGIYATGENTEIVMNSGSKVSGNGLRYSGENGYNYNFGGAGIYISGSGITDTSKLPKLTINTGAEISDNTAHSFCRGGGIYMEDAIVIIAGGKITGNKSGDCAGNIVVTGNNSSLTMTEGEISCGEVNSGASYGSSGSNAYGGGVVLFGGIFEMSGGKICNNKTVPESGGDGNGGGIAMGNATFIMTGGEISGNYIEGTNIRAGAICFEDENAVFKIGGSARIPAGVDGVTGVGKNDVLVGAEKSITITSALSPPESAGGVVATITPNSYDRTDALLAVENGVNLTNVTGKFAVTDNDTSDSTVWTLDSAGKLKAAMTANAAITSIESMSGADNEVVIAGAITQDDITYIKNAISSAYTANNTTRIKLDLSNVTGLNELPSEAFKSLPALEEIILPEGITNLKGTSFCYSCSNLKSVYIPSSVTEFGARDFYGCPKLESITVADENTALKVENDAVYSKDGTKLLLYIKKSNTGSFNVPDSVKRIENYAFCEAKITSISFPDTLEYIGNNAFYYGKLTSVNIPDGVTLDTYAFYYCSLTSVRLPNDLEELGYCTFSGCGFTEITLPASIKKIGESYGGAFSNCANLTTVNYRGTEAQRNAININDDKISNATWNYNYTD